MVVGTLWHADRVALMCVLLRGAFNILFSKSWDFVPTGLILPPSLLVIWDKTHFFPILTFGVLAIFGTLANFDKNFC